MKYEIVAGAGTRAGTRKCSLSGSAPSGLSMLLAKWSQWTAALRSAIRHRAKPDPPTVCRPTLAAT
jgi:hypothetical protein